MKIGIVTETCLTFPGGVQHYSRGLYDFFEKKGHHVEILTCGKESEETRKRFVTRLGKVLEVPLPRYSASAPITFTRSKTIGKFLIKRDFDILHFNGPAGLLSRQLLIYSKAVNILTFHIYHKRIYPFVITPFLPVWRNLTDKFAVKIAVSDTAASYAQKFHPGKYVVIRGGVDLSKYSLVDQKIKEFADGKTNILFVGRLDKRKGIIYLLKAFKKLNNHSDVRLLIVGDGPDKTKAKRFVRKNGLNNVEFLGRVGNDLLPQYQERLKERVSLLTQGSVELDPARIAQEAAFLADRSDISEEIVRAESHLDQFDQIMNAVEPAGRKLNFLLQELNREFNTMGSKVGNAEVAYLIIDVKSELEKIREQIQNVE